MVKSMFQWRSKKRPVIDDAQCFEQVEEFCRERGITALFDFLCQVRDVDPKLYAWCMMPAGFGVRMDTCRQRIQKSAGI